MASVSSQTDTSSADDSSSSWNKLVISLSATEKIDGIGDDNGGGGSSSDYADLFFKLAVDADRSRSSSLAQLDHPTSLSQQVSRESASIGKQEPKHAESGQGDEVFEWDADRLLDSVDLSDVLQKRDDENGPAVLRSDVEFLQSVEPSASPTLRGLANWRDVSGIDSDQLIAKSKE